MTPARYRKVLSWLPAALAAWFALFPTARAHGAGVRMDVVPSVRLEEGWRSNVASTEDDEVSSLGTRVIPSLGLALTAPDDVSIRIYGSYERMWYYDDDAKSSEYNTWNARIDSTGAWRLTPNFSVTPSVFFVNTVDSQRRLQYLPSGDPVLPDVSVIDYGNTKTQTFGGALAFEYILSPKFTLNANGNYSDKRFTDEGDAGDELTNNTQAGGGLGISYVLSPLTKIGLLVSGSRYTFDDNPGSDVFSAGVQYSHQFSPAVRINLTVGASHIRQESEPGVSESESETTPFGSLRLTYVSETFTSAIYGSASYSGSSGYGEATMQYTGGVSLTKRLTTSLSWTLSGYYQQSDSVFEEESIDTNTIHGSTEFRYKPWEMVSLYLNGSANRQESDGQLGDSISDYSANIGVTISNSFNIF